MSNIGHEGSPTPTNPDVDPSAYNTGDLPPFSWADGPSVAEPADSEGVAQTNERKDVAVDDPERGSWAGSVRDGLGKAASKLATGFDGFSGRTTKELKKAAAGTVATVKFGAGVAATGTIMAASIFGRGARGAGRGIGRGVRRVHESVADPDAPLRREEHQARRDADDTLDTPIDSDRLQQRRPRGRPDRIFIDPATGLSQVSFTDPITHETTGRYDQRPPRSTRNTTFDPVTGVSVRRSAIDSITARRLDDGSIEVSEADPEQYERRGRFGMSSTAARIAGVRIDPATGRPARITIPDPTDTHPPMGRARRMIEVNEYEYRGLQWGMPKDLSSGIDESISDWVTARINHTSATGAQNRLETALQRVVNQYWPEAVGDPTEPVTNPEQQQQAEEFVGYIHQEFNRRLRNAEAVRNRFGF